ncbi:carbonic anhydrase-like [Hetaerina americana]|uniref:carbonic anhydrase-like n=1 Tax=Hetaerina americana TaxID=62018 RepID=UPI003A7F353D
MQKVLLLVVTAAIAVLAPSPAHASRGSGLEGAQTDGKVAHKRSRWPRRASSENIYFPTKELEDLLNANRGDRWHAIVFPGNSVTQTVVNTDFGYGPEDGPHTWKKKFPACGGRYQSPIDINLNIAQYPSDDDETDLFFYNYDVPPLEMAVENTGHSLRLTGNWSTGRRPSIEGFVLPEEYSVAEVHFHWGANDREGSEHLIEGQRYPLEMHVVNYKTSYGTFMEATTKNDGLVVISYLFKVHRHINQALQKLLMAYKDITKPKSPGVPIEPFSFDKLVHPFTGNYATYLGSLTTPPCSEIVRWIVNLEPHFVSHEQIETLRGLRRGDGERILFNFRPIQSLNGRAITHVY